MLQDTMLETSWLGLFYMIVHRLSVFSRLLTVALTVSFSIVASVARPADHCE